MRTLIISLLTFFTLANSGEASLLVYKETDSGFLAAAPVRIALTVRGYWVYDTVSGRISEIGVTTINGSKYYIINTNFTQHSVTRVTTPIGQQVIVSRAYSSNSVEGLKMGASFYKGPPAALPIGTGETFNFARTLKGITRGIDAVEGQPAFSESTISMVFSMSETKVANMAGESVDDFLSRWRQNYENRGYVPLPME